MHVPLSLSSFIRTVNAVNAANAVNTVNYCLDPDPLTVNDNDFINDTEAY